MHCPTCGAETNLEQRFCRSCGMDLETVSKLVVAHASPEKLTAEKSLTKKASQQRMYRSIKYVMICFIIGMAALAATKTLGVDKTFNLGPLFLLFMGMLVMFLGVLAPMRDRTSKPRTDPNASRTGQPHEVGTTKELPFARVPVSVPSVTERTTQLIAPARSDLAGSRQSGSRDHPE